MKKHLVFLLAWLTFAVPALVCASNYSPPPMPAPGSSGNIPVSNGSKWTSTAPASTSFALKGANTDITSFATTGASTMTPGSDVIPLTINTFGASQTASQLVIKANASQAGLPLDIQIPGTGYLFTVSPNGTVGMVGGTVYSNGNATFNGAVIAAMYPPSGDGVHFNHGATFIDVATTNLAAFAGGLVHTLPTDVVGHRITANAAQTNPLCEFEANDGTDYFRVLSNGFTAIFQGTFGSNMCYIGDAYGGAAFQIAGYGVHNKSGANGLVGSGTIGGGGNVTVSTTAIDANDIVTLTCTDATATALSEDKASRVGATSFKAIGTAGATFDWIINKVD